MKQVHAIVDQFHRFCVTKRMGFEVKNIPDIVLDLVLSIFALLG